MATVVYLLDRSPELIHAVDHCGRTAADLALRSGVREVSGAYLLQKLNEFETNERRAKDAAVERNPKRPQILLGGPMVAPTVACAMQAAASHAPGRTVTTEVFSVASRLPRTVVGASAAACAPTYMASLRADIRRSLDLPDSPSQPLPTVVSPTVTASNWTYEWGCARKSVL